MIDGNDELEKSIIPAHVISLKDSFIRLQTLSSDN